MLNTEQTVLHAALLNQSGMNIDLNLQSRECKTSNDDKGLSGWGRRKCSCENLADACVGSRSLCQVAGDFHDIAGACALRIEHGKDICNSQFKLIIKRFWKTSINSTSNLTGENQLFVTGGYDGKMAVIGDWFGDTFRIQEFNWHGLFHKFVDKN